MTTRQSIQDKELLHKLFGKVFVERQHIELLDDFIEEDAVRLIHFSKFKGEARVEKFMFIDLQSFNILDIEDDARSTTIKRSSSQYASRFELNNIEDALLFARIFSACKRNANDFQEESRARDLYRMIKREKSSFVSYCFTLKNSI